MADAIAEPARVPASTPNAPLAVLFPVTTLAATAINAALPNLVWARSTSPDAPSLMFDNASVGQDFPIIDDPAESALPKPGACFNNDDADIPMPPGADTKLLATPGNPGLGNPLPNCSNAVVESKRCDGAISRPVLGIL